MLPASLVKKNLIHIQVAVENMYGDEYEWIKSPNEVLFLKALHISGQSKLKTVPKTLYSSSCIE